MSWSRVLQARLHALLRRRSWQGEIDDEVSFHLEMQTAENIRAGMSAREARRQALLVFGSIDGHKEGMRDARLLRWLEELLSDVRYAIRGLRRTPTFTAVAVLTLAFGIGANSALFGLVNALFWRMPPGLSEGDRLVRVEQANPGSAASLSLAEYVAVREGSKSLEALTAFWSTEVDVATAGVATRVRGALTDINYFSVLGTPVALGRTFDPADAVSAANVVVLGHGVWQSRFGAERSVVGRKLILNGVPFTVIGVAAVGFTGTEFEDPAEFWVPYHAAGLLFPHLAARVRAAEFDAFRVVARLSPGANAELAHAELQPIARALDLGSPDRGEPGYDSFRLRAEPLQGWLPPSIGRDAIPVLAFAWLITGLVLLVACANIAGVLLARAVARRREIGIRLALGVSRTRLMRLLLSEAVVLAVAGGALALLFGRWGIDMFQARMFRTFAEQVPPLDVSLDARTLAFTSAIAAATALLCGVMPALRASRSSLATILQGDTPRWLRRSRLQGALVVAQVALTTVLLFTSGLLLRRLQDVASIHPGFDGAGVLSFSFDLASRGRSPAEMNTFYAELRRRVEKLPGVSAATAPASVPFGEHLFISTDLVPAGEAAGGPGHIPGRAMQVSVGTDFFRTLRIPVIRGRAISDADIADARRVAVVSEGFAERHWPDQDPIGKRLVRAGRAELEYEVVGVAGDIASHELAAGRQPHVYTPAVFPNAFFAENLLVRSAADPRAVSAAVIAQIRRLDPTVPVFGLRTVQHGVERELVLQRAFTEVIGGFGLLAATLAALGLYGVVALMVESRVREAGVRRALGATGSQVRGVFLRKGLALAVIGLALGSALAAAAGFLLRALVVDVRPMDSVVLLAVNAMLMTTALLAAFVPAHRAAGVTPLSALRGD